MKVEIGGNKYDVPVSWRELPFRNYIAALDHSLKGESDPVGYLSAITGIEIEVLRNTSVEGLAYIMQMVDFVNDPNGLAIYNKVEDKFQIDIGTQPYWKLELCNQEVKRVWSELYGDKKELTEAEVMHVYLKASSLFVRTYTDGLTYTTRKWFRKKEVTLEAIEIEDSPVASVYGLAVFFCKLLRPLTLTMRK